MSTETTSRMQDGSTLIGDHKIAVDALNDVMTALTAEDVKKIALKALQEIGEAPHPPVVSQVSPLLTTRKG